VRSRPDGSAERNLNPSNNTDTLTADDPKATVTTGGFGASEFDARGTVASGAAIVHGRPFFRMRRVQTEGEARTKCGRIKNNPAWGISWRLVHSAARISCSEVTRRDGGRAWQDAAVGSTYVHRRA